MPRWLHWCILPNVWGTNNSNSAQTLPENREDGMLLSSFYYASITLLLKSDKYEKQFTWKCTGARRMKTTSGVKSRIGRAVTDWCQIQSLSSCWNVVSVPDWRGFLEGPIWGQLEEGGPDRRLRGYPWRPMCPCSAPALKRTRRCRWLIWVAFRL